MAPDERNERQEQQEAGSGRKLSTLRKTLLWVFGILFSLLLILFIASFFLDEPLRRTTEKKMNEKLKGYSVRLPHLHFQLINLSLTLKGLTIIQQAHPDHPVATFPRIEGTVHWSDLLHGALVGEFQVERPEMHINLAQLKEETSKKTPVKKEGWQDVVQDIYPLKINHFTVNNGNITYIDKDPKRPLSLTHLNIGVQNIRNVRSPKDVYPSSFHMDTDIFGKGHVVVDGNANFMAEPVPGLKADFRLTNVPLGYFQPVAERYNVSLDGGILDGAGNVEYAPTIKKARLSNLSIKDMKLFYTHTAAAAPAEKRVAKKTGKAAGEAANKPGLQLRLDKFTLAGCTLGMVDKTAPKPYRVFISNTDVNLTNLSNHFSEGPAKANVTGQFMGTGATTASATFRPEKNGPDFDLQAKIIRTQLTSMNDLLRAYGKFDIVAGYFSLFTELHVKDGKVSGYIKPLFGDLDVYDRRQDKEKNIFRKMYEMLVGGVAKLLENRPREEVATVAEVKGPLKNPKTDTFHVLIDLLKNAFFKAILPRFERQVTGGK